MRFILVSAVLLAQAFTALAQNPAQLPYDARSSCEERAKAAGMCYIISSLQENSVDVIIRHAH
jgi:sialic acid synthase SpsE